MPMPVIVVVIEESLHSSNESCHHHHRERSVRSAAMPGLPLLNWGAKHAHTTALAAYEPVEASLGSRYLLRTLQYRGWFGSGRWPLCWGHRKSHARRIT